MSWATRTVPLLASLPDVVTTVSKASWGLDRFRFVEVDSWEGWVEASVPAGVSPVVVARSEAPAVRRHMRSALLAYPGLQVVVVSEDNGRRGVAGSPSMSAETLRLPLKSNEFFHAQSRASYRARSVGIRIRLGSCFSLDPIVRTGLLYLLRQHPAEAEAAEDGEPDAFPVRITSGLARFMGIGAERLSLAIRA